MNKELFGVFGGRSAFNRYRSPTDFDRVIDAPSVTVGVRDPGLAEPGWTHCATDTTGTCLIWGEAYLPQTAGSPAAWVLDQYSKHGFDAIDHVNGSFLAVIDDGDDPVVVGDPIRSRDCFYTDATTPRVFGTDHAAVAGTLDDVAFDRQSLLEYLHLSVVLGDRTVFESVNRIPFDTALTQTGTDTLDRFVYDPSEFDYVRSLARRLRRAIDRRRPQPGRSGVLLSAGYDSRVIVAELDEVDRSYTLGHPESAEVTTSATIAGEYGVEHDVLDPRDGYLNTDPDTVQYGQAIKESLHAHTALDEASMQVDSLFHGLLFDTVLAGHFRPGRTIEVLGRSVPVSGLPDDLDVTDRLLADNFGYFPLSEQDAFGDGELSTASDAFCREALDTQYHRLAERFDSDANAMAALGLQNQPTLPFHTYLADNYFTPFVAADTELLEWHLHTPPEHRTRDTYKQALDVLGDDLLTPRPPDRPHTSSGLNQLENLLRKRVPGVAQFGTAWPDRDSLYERNGLDDRLFGDLSSLQGLPTRVKLRLNDVVCWSDSVAEAATVDPGDVVALLRNPR